MREPVEETAARRRGVERIREALRFSALEFTVLAVLALLVVGGASLAWVRSRPIPLAQAPATFVEAEPSVAPAAGGTIFVHVVGAVREPGVYELPAGSRAIDAVRAAGGLGPHADTISVNLAKPLTDGEQLVVPKAATTADRATAQQDDGKVNINTADQAGLETLPGIGPALAQRIIEHREANGPFKSVDDLLNVSGIGEATLANLEPYVTV